jgi:CDP-diacylglycerol--glycerol-3-phosphate 3-phosphatidyltransferase
VSPARVSVPASRPDPAGDLAQTAKVVNVANGLTLLRLILVPVFLVLLFAAGGHASSWRIAATIAFAVASITDFIDGDIARSRNLVTDVGKVADPIADKALIGAALIGLSALGDLAWWITAVIGVREVGVTALRFVVIRHGVIPASRGGKLKTGLQGLAIGLYLLPIDGPWGTLRGVLMGAALVVTVVTGFDYVFRAVDVRRAGHRRRAAKSAA